MLLETVVATSRVLLEDVVTGEELKLVPEVLPGRRGKRGETGPAMRGVGEPERPGTAGRRRRGGGTTGGRRRSTGGGTGPTTRGGGERERPGTTGRRRRGGGGASGGRRRRIMRGAGDMREAPTVP